MVLTHFLIKNLITTSGRTSASCFNKLFCIKCRQFSTTPIKGKINLETIGPTSLRAYVEHKRVPHDEPVIDKTNIEIILDGFRVLPEEMKKFGQELKDGFTNDIPVYKEGDLLKLFDFSNEEIQKTWVASTDSSYGVGFSKATWLHSQNKTGVFSGFLDKRVPDDGVTMKACYANIHSPQRYKPFYRVSSYEECEEFTHIVFRCRGDGRTYLIYFDLSEYLDITWGNQQTYYLHTRGGPHWQTTFIPFTKFFRTCRGATQDMQGEVMPGRIKYFGITVAEISGQFRLEIDYIGLFKDLKHKDPFPYENYRANHVEN